MASNPNGTLYIGVTGDLRGRSWRHKNKIFKGFTEKHGVRRLVYYELHGDMESALIREKRLKKWNRAWKLRLINEMNPGWRNLHPELF